MRASKFEPVAYPHFFFRSFFLSFLFHVVFFTVERIVEKPHDFVNISSHFNPFLQNSSSIFLALWPLRAEEKKTASRASYEMREHRCVDSQRRYLQSVLAA